MDIPSNSGTWAEWFGVLATFAAVVVALFGSEIRNLWHRPKVRVVAEAKPPHCHKTSLRNQVPTFGKTQVDCYYLRLLIRNEGSARADGIQVYVSKLSRQTGGGAFRDVSDFLPMNLEWSHGIGASGADVWIAPRMGKHCDLGCIVDPGTLACRLKLTVEFPPNKGTHILDAGTYRLDLRIAGSNFKPIEESVQVSCTGVWYSDEAEMLEKGVSLQLVSDIDE